jgi:hypothetical protein
MDVRTLVVENPLEVSEKTINETDIDVTRLVVFDEFNNKTVAGNIKGDYRDRAIKRLVASGLPFHSECNIVHNMAKDFIKVVCPYCHRNMQISEGSGNGQSWTAHYRCPKCESEAYLSMPTDGISFKMT